jgi:bacterial/archaeal transporter family-2 protein
MKELSSIPYLWIIWAALAGSGIPVMASLNGGLARATGSPAIAVWVLFLVGFGVSTALLVITGKANQLPAIANASPNMFLGGLIVAFYIFAVTSLVPEYGVANVILCVMIAQIVTSATIDHFGLFGAHLRPISLQRLFGISMMIGGLAITQMSESGR